jgi:hypothetical protein
MKEFVHIGAIELSAATWALRRCPKICSGQGSVERILVLRGKRKECWDRLLNFSEFDNLSLSEAREDGDEHLSELS